MDLQRLTIGQMAELNHISEQTLRLYDREGLLKPQETDPVTGYRYYHIMQSARLDLIQNMKVYGMTLRQIRAFLDDNDAAALQKLLLEQAGRVNDRIDQLVRSRAAIMRALENCRRYEAMPRGGEVFLEYIPERYIYRYGCDCNYFEEDEDGYEYMLRQLKRHLVVNNMPLSYFSNIGTIIRRECLERGELYSNEVFLFLDGHSDAPGVERVPAAAYLCLCSDDAKSEEESVRRLLRHINEHGYTIAGDYFCEVIIDFPVLDLDRRHMFYKTQIPVKTRA